MATGEKAGDNSLHISWNDGAWIPILNRGNVLEYFSRRGNPFYDSACNNELIKMQGLSLDHLSNMTGVEYALLHCQEPILYIIRKQIRHSPTQVTAVVDYYIIAGTVYQAPDVKSVINSRLTSTLHHVESALSEAVSYSRYHPSKGYWWQFNDDNKGEGKEKAKKKKKEELGSIFQCGRVDQLLENLRIQFPHQFYQAQPGGPPIPIHQQNGASNADTKSDAAVGSAQALPAAANAVASGGVNLRATQSPIPGNVQSRVRTEVGDGLKQPIEKRTKYM